MRRLDDVRTFSAPPDYRPAAEWVLARIKRGEPRDLVLLASLRFRVDEEGIRAEIRAMGPTDKPAPRKRRRKVGDE